MEVQVFFNDGAVETHRVPDLVGKTVSVYNPTSRKEEGWNELDQMADIVESFRHEPGTGFFLERHAVHVNSEGRTREVKHKSSLVLPDAALADVRLILVDGEQVWPVQTDEVSALGDAQDKFDALFAAV